MVKSEFCLVKDPNKFPWLLPLNHHCSMVKFLFSPDEIQFSFFLSLEMVKRNVGCLIVITPPIFFLRGGQPSYNDFWESIAGIMICI